MINPKPSLKPLKGARLADLSVSFSVLMVLSQRLLARVSARCIIYPYPPLSLFA
jgi:hypothetical protein